MENNDIQMPVTKVVSLWAVIGVTSWTEAAAFAGFVYSMILIGEWLWKKIVRKIAEQRGWVKKRRPMDTDMGTLR
jgi:hypothetical protein